MEEGGTGGWRDGAPAAAASSSFAARRAARCCFPPAQLPLPVSPRTLRALSRVSLPCGTRIPQPTTPLPILPLFCPPDPLPALCSTRLGSPLSTPPPAASHGREWPFASASLHPPSMGARNMASSETSPEHPSLVFDLDLLWFLSPRVWYLNSQIVLRFGPHPEPE